MDAPERLADDGTADARELRPFPGEEHAREEEREARTSPSSPRVSPADNDEEILGLS